MRQVLSAERPHPSIFCAYFFLSVLGQFALHLSFLIFMYRQALDLMPSVRVLSVLRILVPELSLVPGTPIPTGACSQTM